MKSELAVEPGVQKVVGHCDRCGHESRVFRGFVRVGGSAHAVYVARYTEGHPEMGVAMAVSLHGWGERADTSLKECVALEWRNFDSGPGCSVLEASSSPWASETSLGRMLSRDEAMASGRAQEAFDVTDAVWATDTRLPEAVHGS